MMKKLLTLILVLTVWPTIAAGIDSNDLLSAQADFRQALNAQTSNTQKINTLQANLSSARIRVQQAQADVSRLENELQAAMTEKSQNDAALEAAGKRLNAAWQANRGGH